MGSSLVYPGSGLDMALGCSPRAFQDIALDVEESLWSVGLIRALLKSLELGVALKSNPPLKP